MQNNNTTQAMQNNPAIQNQEEEIDIKRLFFLLLRKWYWLLICLVIGIVGAFLYSKYQHQVYQIDTSIIAPENGKGLDLTNLFEQSMPGAGGVTIINEIELLKSYTLNNNVVENLNWRTSWYKKDLFIWKGLYIHEPFIVQELGGGINPWGINIYIALKNNKQYQISASGTTLINKQEVEINFTGSGTFGNPFKNDYFNFILHPKEELSKIAGNEYRFSFLDKNKLTFNYLNKINIALTNKMGEVIRLSLEGTEPLREIHYLNELVRVYLDLKLEQQTKTQKRSLEFIDGQLAGISDSLSVAENNFTDFRSKNQIIDLSTQGELVMEQLGTIEQEKSQHQMQLDYFRNLQSYLGKTENIKKIITPSVVGIQDPSLNALVLKLSELYSRREILSFSAHENNPTLVLLNNEIDQVNNQLRENLVNLIDNAQISIASLEKRYNRINRQLNNLPGQEQQLINIRRQYELTNEIYTFMLQTRAELEIALAGTVVDIHIVDPARMERILPTGMNRNIILILGALLGLIIPVILILLSDLFNNKIHHQEDVEKLTTLTIIGNVLHSKTKSELVVFDDPIAPISESYRTIRTNLQYKLTQGGQKVIGIHSISPSEGKTFSATNLASILAMNDKKTLLIGADLRKPRLHKVFETSNKIGLSNFLIGQVSAEEIIRETKVENLWLVPSGPIPPNPAELLERTQLNEFIEQAKTNFDYIIIDNAPVSMVTDGLITSKYSDLNLFILRYAVSRKDQLKFINEIANKGVMKNSALIINDIKLDRFSYGYSYSYKYAYGKGYSES
jgi:tyrosine-protein kinase Etk/Wzc